MHETKAPTCQSNKAKERYTREDSNVEEAPILRKHS
jgi:hypothetical protein